MRILIYLLCVALPLTRISFFKMGMAEFTIFHFLVLVVLFFKFFIGLKNKSFVWKQPINFTFALGYLICVNLLYIRSIKMTSFIYSVLILTELILLYNILRRLTMNDIGKIIKTIILLYFINIAVSSVFILLHISPGHLLGKIFQIYDFDNRLRPYGFSDEPSYAALILVFSFFVLLKINDFRYKSSELIWYVITIASIVLTGSTYGYLILAILMLYFIYSNNFILRFLEAIEIEKLRSTWKLKVTLFSLLLIVLVTGVILLNNNRSIKRLATIFVSVAASSVDEDESEGAISKISKVDGSASMRFVPSILMIESYKNDKWRYILMGRGAGQSVPFFSGIFSTNTVLGFIPSFIYNYGIIGFFIFIMLFLSLFPKDKFVLLVLFILFLFNADFNTQIFSFVLFTIMLSKQIESIKQNEKLIESK